MPKNTSGGKRAKSSAPKSLSSGVLQRKQAAQPAPAQPAPAQTQPVQPAPTPSPSQVAKGNILPKGGVPFSQFETMTDDQKAQVISDALKTGTPAFLDDSDLQKFAYFTGMSDKPQVVSESQLQSMTGQPNHSGRQDLWRSVHDGYNRATDIGYTKEDILEQIRYGDYTNYSDGGGSVYGKGIYFDDSRGSYGSGSKYAILHAKISPSARVITSSSLSRMYHGALRNGDALATACSKADYESAEHLYALAKGYDIVNTGYTVVLNRRGLVVSDKNF